MERVLGTIFMLRDLASAHVAALHYLATEKQNQIFNCGYGRGYSVREVIEQVKQSSNTDFPVLEVDRRDRRSRLCYCRFRTD